jgi:hypothetical protein
MNKYETYLFTGAIVRPLLDSTESGGHMSVTEFTHLRGLEPPFHIHENEEAIDRRGNDVLCKW